MTMRMRLEPSVRAAYCTILVAAVTRGVRRPPKVNPRGV